MGRLGVDAVPALQRERALQVSKAPLGPTTQTIGIWRANLGNVLDDLGALSSTRAQLGCALPISESALATRLAADAKPRQRAPGPRRLHRDPNSS